MLRFVRFPYASGVLTGLIIALPLAISASWIGAVAATRLSDADTVQAQPPVITMTVNRSAKAARLPLTSITGEGSAVTVRDIDDASTSIVAKGASVVKSAPRSNGTPPRGCLSAIGGLPTGTQSDKMTVCVADASMIND